MGGGGDRGGGGGRGGGVGRTALRHPLKEEIVALGRLDNGLELYRFRYKGSDRTVYVGVMAQDVQKIEPNAVRRDRDGYLRVDYDRIGLKFMTLERMAGTRSGRTVRRTMRKLGCFVLGAALFVCAPASAQQQFDSADAAVTALVTAAKEHHKSAINKILGPKGQKIISSGDKVADSRTREDFVAAYDKKHAIENEGEDKATLVIGDNDWPFPIPLVRKDEKWSFDTKAGLDEILRRRIGRNELSAIQVSLAYVQAQNEYASLDPDRLGPHVYAAAHREQRRQEGWTLLADRRGRRAKPARRSRGESIRRGL